MRSIALLWVQSMATSTRFQGRSPGGLGIPHVSPLPKSTSGPCKLMHFSAMKSLWMKSYGTLTIPGPGTYRKDLTRPVARVGGPLAPPPLEKILATGLGWSLKNVNGRINFYLTQRLIGRIILTRAKIFFKFSIKFLAFTQTRN